jgi:cytidylate kinase
MERKIVIAIDGYSGCGKSTLARQLAERLGYTYVDTGAMYRAITLYFIRMQVAIGDEASVGKALSSISLAMTRDPDTGRACLQLNGKDVDQDIRDLSVSKRVSEVAAIPAVREFAVRFQRQLRSDHGIVMDGRDIGTVVFPDAELKIFMTADLAVRVDRRFKEIRAVNSSVTREEIEKDLTQRDYLDTHRDISPLRQADDAVLIDNSALSPEQQLDLAEGLAREAIGVRAL